MRNGSKPELEVAVIGAGMSGIGMGAALRRAGVENFRLLERAHDVGGTWRDNTYPGLTVDIPSFAYQFSYELKPDWSRFFATGAEVKVYVDQFVNKYGLRPHIVLDSEVTARTWDEDSHLWRLEINGGEREVTARYVISAIGAFVDPKLPEYEGLDDFGGKVIHSARWDHSYDLRGKRVAVVGTGASAIQIIPKIAGEVGHLGVYQRTPIWISPKFDPKIPAFVKWLFAKVPPTERIAYWVTTVITEFVLIQMVIHYRRLPFAVRFVERQNKRFVRASVRDPELQRKLTPQYGFGCKRPSVSNTYLRTFNRDNVELVTEPIARITDSGIRTLDGEERPHDVIVLATGFRLATDPENYRRTPVRGANGFDLATQYTEHRVRSYEGISMPGLPNHFILFGPYGFIGAAWQSLVETGSRHILRVLREADRREATRVEVSEEATERWFHFAERRISKSLWHTPAASCATANSYYFDHHGDTPYLRPTSSWQARRAARRFSLDDYVYSSNGHGAAALEAERTAALR